MMCQMAREWITQMLDGELDAARRQELERHLESCLNCTDIFERASLLREKIRGDSPYYEAPESLLPRVRAALRREQAKTLFQRPWWQAAAAVAAVLMAGVLLWNGRDHQDAVTGELVTAHVRAMLPGHLIDVPSSDQHTVKPWFNGKLDFAPRVEDLTAKGFELKGGRLDYLYGRTVAALVFQRRQHVIDLFIAPGSLNQSRTSANGYTILQWPDRGMTYRVVSDLNAVELELFKTAYLE